jgi:iron complex outermembrane receptor protein
MTGNRRRGSNTISGGGAMPRSGRNFAEFRHARRDPDAIHPGLEWLLLMHDCMFSPTQHHFPKEPNMKTSIVDLQQRSVSRIPATPFRPPFRLFPMKSMACLVTAAFGTFGTGAFAQTAEEKTIAELQSEIRRANDEVQRLKQELELYRGAETPAGGASGTPETAPGATAQTEVPATPQTLGSVVVRSRRALERLHDVPVSISVISGNELQREGATDFEAITKRLGNIQFNQNNTRGSSLSIRGVGRRGFTETQDPSVGLIVDGVSYGLTQLGNFDFYDVQSVEVARGPQGTLLGKGASAGAVTITSRQPAFTPSANYELSYGERETVVLQGGLGGPIIDGLLAWRGAFIVNKQRGFYINDYNEKSNDTMYNRDRVSARSQFLLTPSENFSAKFSFDIQPRDAQLQNGLTEYVEQPRYFANGSLTDPNGTSAKAKLVGFTNAAGVFTEGRAWFQGRRFAGDQAYSYYDDYLRGPSTRDKVFFNQVQGQVTKNNGAVLELNWFNGPYTLTSLSAFREYSFDARNDEGTPFDINKNGGGGVFYKQWSQEFRLAAKPGPRLDWQAGLFHLRTRDSVESKSGWGSDAGAWFATDAQYNTLDRNAGNNRGAGLALLKDSLQDAQTWGEQAIKTDSSAIFGQANFHPTASWTITTGLRLTREDRSTTNNAKLLAYGAGAALNPVASRTVALGGFEANAAGELSANNSAAQRALADAVANRYYNVPIDPSNPGAAYESLEGAQKSQVAAARAIRAAQIGALVNNVRSTYKDTLYTGLLTPSYKFNENITAYASWQYGEKSGSALNINGVPTQVKPEKTNAYEIGFKSFLLNRTLTLNADVFLMDIKDYQQTVVAVDEFATETNIANGIANPLVYASVQGNVPKVEIKGVEIDAEYNGIPWTSLRLSAAYNDARYKKFPNAGKPSELAYLPEKFIDRSGERLGEAPLWTFTLGAEYRRPLWGKIFHASFTTAYTSKYNTDELISAYSWKPSSSTTDLAIGLGTVNGLYDVTLVAKNAFDDRTHEHGWASYTPYPYPRWIGITFSGRI